MQSVDLETSEDQRNEVGPRLYSDKPGFGWEGGKTDYSDARNQKVVCDLLIEVKYKYNI